MSLDLDHFHPWMGLLGGVVIGLAALSLAAFNGRIAGISGIVGGALERSAGLSWRLAFMAGLLVAPWLFAGVLPLVPDSGSSVFRLICAGMLVGFGTRMAAGCTSGHGVCGLARLSPRSLVAVLSFMAAGFATTYVLEHL